MAAAGLLIGLALPCAAQAAKLTIDVPGAAPAQTITAQYGCKGGSSFTVQYVTIGGSSLAVLPVKGQTLIFAQGPSADGGRYVSGFYAWWSKGNTGSLFDERSGSDAPILTCTAK